MKNSRNDSVKKIKEKEIFLISLFMMMILDRIAILSVNEFLKGRRILSLYISFGGS